MGFDEWYKKVGVARHYIYANEKWIAKIGFEAGAESRQAEIDELQKRIDSIQEIMSAGVYHIPTLIKDLNNALKGESNE